MPESVTRDELQSLREHSDHKFEECRKAIGENASQIALINQAAKMQGDSTDATNKAVGDLTQEIKDLLTRPDKGLIARVGRLESFVSGIKRTLGHLWGFTGAIVLAAVTALVTFLINHFGDH